MTDRHNIPDENMARLIEMMIDRYIDANPTVFNYKELAQHIVAALKDGRVSFVEPQVTYERTIQP